jgi:hypothetical protein
LLMNFLLETSVFFALFLSSIFAIASPGCPICPFASFDGWMSGFTSRRRAILYAPRRWNTSLVFERK